MSILEALRPTSSHRVMDLASSAGIDVSGWANFKGGEAKAASNPKYCYEWAFIENGKVALVNLWHKDLVEIDDNIQHPMNYRRVAADLKLNGKKAIWIKRAQKVDEILHTAYIQKLPIHAVICDGTARGLSDTASTVKKRSLDPVLWHISSYDAQTGQCVLVRGIAPPLLVDQFSIPDYPDQITERRSKTGEVYLRSAAVRQIALSRAQGKCEWCREMGFVMPRGEIFLETHHIVPLSEGGKDAPENVAALCPNHHREAHLGKRSARIREDLVKLRNPSQTSA